MDTATEIPEKISFVASGTTRLLSGGSSSTILHSKSISSEEDLSTENSLSLPQVPSTAKETLLSERIPPSKRSLSSKIAKPKRTLSEGVKLPKDFSISEGSKLHKNSLTSDDSALTKIPSNWENTSNLKSPQPALGCQPSKGLSRPNTAPPSRGLQLSFAGCGFLGIYHVGASACLRKYAPDLFLENVAGASAGAMAGACLLCDADLGCIRSSIISCAVDARSSPLGPFTPGFHMQQLLRKGLDQVLPANAHQIVSGRLFVSVTRVSDGKNVLLSHFETREDLLRTLLCSSFIPVFSGFLPMTVGGVRYMDGGFTDNLPQLDDSVVTFSPFSGEADVCPKDTSSAGVITFSVTNTNFHINGRNVVRLLHAMFPPSPEELNRVCQQGFNDTLDFLQRTNLVSCSRCSPRTAFTTHSDSSQSNYFQSSDSENVWTVGDKNINRRKNVIDDDDGNSSSNEYEIALSENDNLENDIHMLQESCVNCPDCRERTKESVMNRFNKSDCTAEGGFESSLMVPRPVTSLGTIRLVVSFLSVPLTGTVKWPFSFAGRVVSSLSSPALLRLHAFTSQVACLIDAVLLSRRRAAILELPAPDDGGTVFIAADGGDRSLACFNKRGDNAESEVLTRLARQYAARSSRWPKAASRSDRRQQCHLVGSCVIVCSQLPGLMQEASGNCNLRVVPSRVTLNEIQH